VSPIGRQEKEKTLIMVKMGQRQSFELDKVFAFQSSFVVPPMHPFLPSWRHIYE
jgi:hypothetical protein